MQLAEMTIMASATARHSALRAAGPQTTIGERLGPLAELRGTWVGNGFSLISLPDWHDNQPFRLQLNATKETLSFTVIGAPIPDRGSQQDDITFLGLHYFQLVSDAVTNESLHSEPGIWLNVPGTTAPQQGQTIVRLATIPHGNALLAQGPLQCAIDGRPVIGAADSIPFTLDPVTGVRWDITDPQYLDRFFSTPVPAGIPADAIANPNLVLIDAIKSNAKNGQKIVKTEVLSVSAMPIGGINDSSMASSSAPLAQQKAVGGLVSIPFLATNANAISFAATFWIETVQGEDGSSFLQLQYTQTVILDFIDMKWPHISVATLVKQ
jgi:hypothetical protein